MVSRERQLNFLLPINSHRADERKCSIVSAVVDRKDQAESKRYLQIKQSLKAKGLVKSSKY